MSRSQALRRLRAPATERAALHELAARCELSVAALQHFGVSADASRDEARRVMRRAVGPKAFKAAMSKGTPTAKGLALIRAARQGAWLDPDTPEDDAPPYDRKKPRKAGRGPRSNEPEHAVDDEPDPNAGELCQRCGHENEVHMEGTGPCSEKGCNCRRFVAPDEGDDEPEPSTTGPETPEEAAVIDNVMRRSSAALSRDQVRAIYRAQFGQPKPKTRRPKTRRARTREDVIANVVRRTGMPREQVARAYDAQFKERRR